MKTHFQTPGVNVCPPAAVWGWVWGHVLPPGAQGVCTGRHSSPQVASAASESVIGKQRTGAISELFSGFGVFLGDLLMRRDDLRFYIIKLLIVLTSADESRRLFSELQLGYEKSVGSK